MQKVLHLANTVLQLKPPLQEAEIDRYHRTGPREDRQGNRLTWAILIKFVSYTSRARVLHLRRRLFKLVKGQYPDRGAAAVAWPTNDPTQHADDETTSENQTTDTTHDDAPIDYSAYKGAALYFNEDLTATRSKLAWKARQLKKQHKINDTWTINDTESRTNMARLTKSLMRET